MIVGQQSLVDPSRAPAGKHTGWAYCHVPNGSTVDMTSRMEAQLERFAPGFRDTVLQRYITSPAHSRPTTPTTLEETSAQGPTTGCRCSRALL